MASGRFKPFVFSLFTSSRPEPSHRAEIYSSDRFHQSSASRLLFAIFSFKERTTPILMLYYQIFFVHYFGACKSRLTPLVLAYGIAMSAFDSINRNGSAARWLLAGVGLGLAFPRPYL